jgi:hypothetical protein
MVTLFLKSPPAVNIVPQHIETPPAPTLPVSPDCCLHRHGQNHGHDHEYSYRHFSLVLRFSDVASNLAP